MKFVGPVYCSGDPLMCWKWLKSQNFQLLFMHSTWTVAFVSNYAWKKKNEKKKRKGKRRRGKRIRHNNLNPNGHYMFMDKFSGGTMFSLDHSRAFFYCWHLQSLPVVDLSIINSQPTYNYHPYLDQSNEAANSNFKSFF